MIRTLKIAGLFLFLAAILAAADMNGKWTGSVDTPDGAVPLTFNLTAKGASLTGTVTATANGPASTINDGKVEGEVGTFSWVTDYHGDSIKLLCKVQVTSDGLKIQMGTEDGGWSTEFVAKKAS